MKNKTTYVFTKIIFLFLTGMSSMVCAQDIHFSQFNASPQNLNPAQTGIFNGDWRFAGNYRSQWSAIPVPYKTFSFSTDTRLKTKLANDVPAVGILINSDKAGDSRFSTNQVFISGSYIKRLNKDSTQFVSVGIQPGVTTKSFDITALTFDNQFDGDAYNAALASGENFPKTRITYFDLGTGLAYLWRKNQRTFVNAGVSFLHINKPKQSFFNNDAIRLDTKINASAIAELPLTATIGLAPTFQYQKQGKFNETVLGAFGKYYLKPINGMNTAVSLGAFYRLKDAFIMVAGMEYKNINVGMSYDFNTSRLTAATNRRGGFEISVIYIFRKIVPFVAKQRVCPIYM